MTLIRVFQQPDKLGAGFLFDVWSNMYLLITFQKLQFHFKTSYLKSTKKLDKIPIWIMLEV